MLRAVWKRRSPQDDGGFTLIELMVVVLIIAVLVAIAIPSFLGFRNRAQDRSSQAEIRNVVLAEKAYWTDNGFYVGDDATPEDVELALNDYEPSINIIDEVAFLAGDPGVDVWEAAGAQEVCIAAISGSGTMFMVWDSATAGSYYGSGSDATTVQAGNCPNAAPAGFGQGGW